MSTNLIDLLQQIKSLSSDTLNFFVFPPLYVKRQLL